MPASARQLRAASSLVAFSLSACTAILVPDDDEQIALCDVTTDCPELADNRYVSVCVLPDGLDPGADKVCAADYATVQCGGTAYGPNHPLSKAYAAAVADPARYAECPPELLGARGCGPGPDGCAAGLIVNPYGTCDDPDAEVLSVGAGQLELDEVLGRDVSDQFCRAFFCDARMVCSHRTDTPRCVPCEPDRFFGRAGCGTLFVQGQPSSVYLDAQTGNCAGELGTEAVEFGPI